VLSGGSDSNVTIASDGTAIVSAGGAGIGATVRAAAS
jgi:autotransporter passenger strand-loop-strand repeat protein